MYGSSTAGIIRIPDSLCCIIIKDFACRDRVLCYRAGGTKQLGRRERGYDHRGRTTFGQIAFLTIFGERTFPRNSNGKYTITDTF